MSIRLASKFNLVAIAGAAVIAASAAGAQNYDRGRSDTTETITVYAPHLKVDRRPMNGPVEKVSLSRSVRYDDRDLRTRSGARELRMRVNAAASDVCSQLADIDRVPEQPGTSCLQAARQDALLKADAAIRDARSY